MQKLLLDDLGRKPSDCEFFTQSSLAFNGFAMKKETIGYYPYDERQLADLWSQGLFIFDSSVLLGLYRYPDRTRKDLMKVLHRLAPRIWIPHQVALEYQENRLRVIREQSTKYGEVISLLEDTKRKLIARIHQLQLETRHSFIEPSDFLPRISQTFDELLSDLRELGAEHPDLYQNDYIREELDALFDGRVGPAPKSQEDLEEIYREGVKRYKERYPPGYEDSEKEKELRKRGEPTAYFYNGLRLQKQFGDLILWHQLLAELRNRENVHYVSFVTDDEKEDWWWKERQPASRQMTLLGPRPELVQEVTAIPDISLFQMYRSDSFMGAARKHLKLDIAQDSIKRARTIIRGTSEARLLREALQETGPLETWQRNDDENVQAWVVRLEDGRYGLMFVEVASGILDRFSGVNWRERASFVPRDGRLEQIRDYLRSVAVRIEDGTPEQDK